VHTRDAGVTIVTSY